MLLPGAQLGERWALGPCRWLRCGCLAPLRPWQLPSGRGGPGAPPRPPEPEGRGDRPHLAAEPSYGDQVGALDQSALSASSISPLPSAFMA